MTAFAPQYFIKIAALLLLFSLPQDGHAASQKMMWVLASFAEADLAAKEADRVSELIGLLSEPACRVDQSAAASHRVGTYYDQATLRRLMCE